MIYLAFVAFLWRQVSATEAHNIQLVTLARSHCLPYPVKPVCTSLLFILLFIKSQYTVFAHLICFALFILLHILLFISLFLPYIYALVLCYSYIIFIFILLHCPLSGPDLIYISLLIIPCLIYYVTNKQTLNLVHRRHYVRRSPIKSCKYQIWFYVVQGRFVSLGNS